MGPRQRSRAFPAAAVLLWMGGAGIRALDAGGSDAHPSQTPGEYAVAIPAIHLRIDDPGNVARADLDLARLEVERVFDAAGVDVRWTAPEPVGEMGSAGGIAGAAPRRINVLIATMQEPRRPATGCALGLAVPSRSTAYVFFNRLRAAAETRPMDLAVALGRVIAHEIGHVLLHPRPHSAYGLMRADLDLDFRNPGRFTDDEAETIRGRLAAPSEQPR